MKRHKIFIISLLLMFAWIFAQDYDQTKCDSLKKEYESAYINWENIKTSMFDGNLEFDQWNVLLKKYTLAWFEYYNKENEFNRLCKNSSIIRPYLSAFPEVPELFHKRNKVEKRDYVEVISLFNVKKDSFRIINNTNINQNPKREELLRLRDKLNFETIVLEKEVTYCLTEYFSSFKHEYDQELFDSLKSKIRINKNLRYKIGDQKYRNISKLYCDSILLKYDSLWHESRILNREYNMLKYTEYNNYLDSVEVVRDSALFEALNDTCECKEKFRKYLINEKYKKDICREFKARYYFVMSSWSFISHRMRDENKTLTRSEYDALLVLYNKLWKEIMDLQFKYRDCIDGLDNIDFSIENNPPEPPPFIENGK